MVNVFSNEFKTDVVFLQEHWLTPDKLFELYFFSPDYIALGVSAMEKAVVTDIYWKAKGRRVYVD